MRPTLKSLSMILLSFALFACSSPVAPVVVRQKVPDSLLGCGSAPIPNAAPTEGELAGFILDLANWGGGCADHLARVRELLH
jgi:hypothetical protein